MSGFPFRDCLPWSPGVFGLVLGAVLWPDGEQVDVGLESISSAPVSAPCGAPSRVHAGRLIQNSLILK